MNSIIDSHIFPKESLAAQKLKTYSGIFSTVS